MFKQTHFDYSRFHRWLQIVSVLDCKGSNPEAESGNASVEAVGFCQDSSFSLAATGNLDGVLCIWDISRGVRPFYKTAVVFSSLVSTSLHHPYHQDELQLQDYIYVCHLVTLILLCNPMA
jgi:hypothetical protein